MRKSHVCLGCGQEIRHVAAPLDPHYQLPVVVCPTCGQAAVRGPNRILWKKTARSAWWFSVQVGMATIVMLVVSSTILGLDLRRTISNLTSDPLMAFTTIAAVVALIAAGAWMGAALRHIVLWQLLLGFCGVLIVIVLLGAVRRPWQLWPTLRWHDVADLGQVALLVLAIVGAAAAMAQLLTRSGNQRAMAKRMRKRRKQIARLTGQ